MKVFKLSAAITVSAYTEVEAESLEEAIDLANSRTACLLGSGYGPDEFWIVGDADGMAQDIKEY